MAETHSLERGWNQSCVCVPGTISSSVKMVFVYYMCLQSGQMSKEAASKLLCENSSTKVPVSLGSGLCGSKSSKQYQDFLVVAVSIVYRPTSDNIDWTDWSKV